MATDSSRQPARRCRGRRTPFGPGPWLAVAAALVLPAAAARPAPIQDGDATFDPDPFLTNHFVVVNHSAVTQTYTVAVSALLNPAFLANTIVQSNTILTLDDDDNAAGASASP